MVSLVEEPTSTDQIEVLKSNGEEKSVDPCQPDSTDKPVEIKQSAAELLAEGRRHLFCQEFAPAVEKLAQSCLLHDDQYGKQAVECSDAYYYYGESLLELARLEPGVLGNALQGVTAEEESSEDEDEEAEENGEKPQTNGETADTTTAEPVVSEVPTDVDVQFEDPAKLTDEERKEIHVEVEKAFEENAEEADRILNGKSNGETPAVEIDTKDAESSSPVVEEVADDGVEGEDSAAEDDQQADTTEVGEETAVEEAKTDENESNLELAWEMLDLARVLYEKQEGREFKLKAAQCRLKLGEVSIESDNIPKALEDLQICVDLRKELMPANDRGLAEVYYQIGLAHSVDRNYKAAGAAFTEAKVVLEAKKAQLMAESEAIIDDNEKVKFTRELAELDALIPDLQMKIDDCSESEKNAERDREALAAAIDPSAPADHQNGISTEKSDQKANDITNLLRKPMKRKSHEADSTAEGDEQLEAKRLKASNGTSVHDGENGCTNGHNGETNGHSEVVMLNAEEAK